MSTGGLPGTCDSGGGHDDGNDGPDDDRGPTTMMATVISADSDGTAGRRTSWAPVPQSAPAAQTSCFQIGAASLRASIAESGCLERLGAVRRRHDGDHGRLRRVSKTAEPMEQLRPGRCAANVDAGFGSDLDGTIGGTTCSS